MRISVIQIAPRGGFSFAILAQAGLEPAPAYCRMVFKTISYTNSDIEPSLLICESPNIVMFLEHVNLKYIKS